MTQDNSTAQLLPCPFCGDSAMLSRFGLTAEVLCTNCNARSPVFHATNEAKAIAAWNTRAPVSQDAAQLVERLLEELDGWEQAYPLSAFPEPDLKKAAKLLKADGMTLDAVSASNMRHVVSRLAPKVRETIEALTRPQPSTGLDMGAQHE